MKMFLTAAIVGLTAMAGGTAAAQTVDTAGPHSAYCGSWQNGTFAPNGNCVEETTTTTTTTSTVPGSTTAVARVPSRVRGTITAVQGHLVTVQQSTQTLVIDDSRALTNKKTGRVAVGRQMVAHGYWDNGTFYAMRMD